MSDTTNGLAAQSERPAPPALAVDASPLENAINSLGIIWCNVPLTSDEGIMLLEASVVETTIVKKARFGDGYHLVAALIRKPSGSNPVTGEVYTAPWTTLLMSDGETMGFGSQGVVDTLAILTMNRPAGIFSPPILMSVEEIDCANTHRRIVLRRVRTEPADVAKKGGKSGK